MSWINVGIMAGSALLSSRNAANRREQQEKYNKAQSEVTKYSPWTGVTGKMDNSYVPDALEAGLSGGMQGLGMAQAVNGAFAAKPAAGGSEWEMMMQEQGMQPAAQTSRFGRGPSMMG